MRTAEPEVSVISDDEAAGDIEDAGAGGRRADIEGAFDAAGAIAGGGGTDGQAGDDVESAGIERERAAG